MSNNKQSRVDLEFVPDEEALALKEIGFNEPCFKYVYMGDTGINVNHHLEVNPSQARNFNEDSLSISQPTFSQAFRFFREKYKLVAIVSQFGWGIANEFGQIIHNIGDSEIPSCFEEAELACLRKLIEIVKEKQNEKQ